MRIVKELPLAEPRRRGRALKYPWKDLAVGDVMVVEEGDFGGTSLEKIRLAAYSWARINGVKFTTQMGSNNRLFVQRVK
jgi:hypothetical protein